MEFKGKKALITGSAVRFGRHVALELAKQGADVAIHYRDSEKEAEKVVNGIKEMGRKSQAFPAELTDAKQAVKMVRDASEFLHGLDILVNNASSVYVHKHVTEVQPDEWKRVLDTDLNGAFYCTHAVLPIMHMQKYGRIINMGAVGCGIIQAKPLTTAYSAAKTGLLILTKSVAASEVQNGITCNMVSPGIMEISEEKRNVPLKRYAKYDEVLRAVLFLASEKSAYITGQNMEVAGAYQL
ncbi:SDR family oxidoreductase [Candidatus Micrarchaeota archaeon]|nr:SDR family oxidoreductase [Candidatus Micrarchaeota archaeon]